ncbi:MAG: hypothetical protein CM1200mP10_15700 [Candidatus Neomarinimicrobiota bacterium]|nr:MAG: hypothetical protein CM1200mP10_15700 [Candidatus Neomarinimicrobiota bacterium]
MKISDKLEDFKAQGKTYFSFEFFPPKTDFGLDNLYSRIDRMASLQPAYIDITWGAGGSTADRTLEMSKTIQKYFGLEVMMHLTCTKCLYHQLIRSYGCKEMAFQIFWPSRDPRERNWRMGKT